MGKLISIMISIGLLILANQAAIKWRRSESGSNVNATLTAAFHAGDAPANSNSGEWRYTNARSNSVIGKGDVR
jgi:hypothetical protein